MALSTYADLLAAVGDWLARADLAPRIPDFVALAETRIAYGSGPPWPSEPVRVRAMEAEAALSIAAETVPLPDGFLEAIRLELDGPPRMPVESAAPEYLYRAGDGVRTGRPRLYAIEGGSLVFAPPPDGTYSARLLYVKRLDPLAATPTNWLLANAPAVYLQATLLEAALYTREDERVPLLHAAFKAAAEGVTAAEARGRAAGTSMRVRPSVGAV